MKPLSTTEVNYQETSSFLPRKRVLIAYCESEKCAHNSAHTYKRVIKEAHKSATYCSDCGNALIWERK